MAIKTVQVTLDGATHTLSLNSSTGLYEATITAPAKSSFNLSGGYYPMTVTATDDAGNTVTANSSHETLGESLRLVVVEQNAPVITISRPTEGQYMTSAAPQVVWTVTDDDSGVDPDTISITINNGAAITDGISKTATTNGYSCSYTVPALSDGTNTIKINASDNDGNAATQRTVNFIVDTKPPVLSVDTPANNLITNSSTVELSGTTSDITSSPVTLTVSVNDGTAQTVAVGSDGSFNTTIQLTKGANSITVVAADKAGKTSNVTRTVTVDQDAPVISSVTVSPNPVSAGGIVTIAVEVTD